MARSSQGEISRGEAEQLIASIPHWHHTFEIVPGVVTPGTYNPTFMLEKLRLEDDLSGQRVLDVGTSDGFFALNMRRRGAEVVAVDYRPKSLHGFGVMERLSGLDFDYRQANLYSIDPETWGTFDIVIFLGVLYHLPDMLRALNILRSVCSGRLFLETHCAAGFSPGVSAARYYRGSSLNNDLTNFWSPNPECLRDMLYDAGFDLVREEAWSADRYFAASQISHDYVRAYKMHLGYSLVPES